MKFLNIKKEVFARGEHKYETLQEVAEEDSEYLVWLVQESNTDQVTKDYIESWLEEHPQYLNGVDY